MEIRRLDTNDVETVEMIIHTFFTNQPKEQSIKNFLANEQNIIIACKVNDEVAGFTYGYKLDRFDGRKSMMYMHQIDVQPTYKKQGLGTKIMEEFIRVCKENDCGRLFLITNKSNSAAVNLYKKVKGTSPSDDDVVFIIDQF